MTSWHGRCAALHNLGCKVNTYETQAMQYELEQAGYTIVPFEPGADVYVINTCSVTNIADRKSRQMLHRARRMNPDAVIVAAGCYVQTATEKTHHEIEADIILGSGHKSELVPALEEFFAGHPGRHAVSERAGLRRYEAMQIDRPAERTRAFIKVQDGCDRFCSYCIIPYARGPIRSRSCEDVVRELQTLASSGVHEVVLTGIHLSSYGLEHSNGQEDAAAGPLLELIRASAAVPGIERIRLGSLEPGIVTEEFARGLADIPGVCAHFHLSLQSGSDRVLQRMNRHYSAEQFYEKTQLLRECFDRPALTTDVIVGFPGETEEEFEETVRFLERIRFYETHIFRFSPRAGTRAASMPGQLTEREKAGRSGRLIALGLENKKAYEDEWCRSPVQLLIEERIEAPGGAWYLGHTKEYIEARMSAETEGMTGRILEGTLSRPEEGGDLIFTPER